MILRTLDSTPNLYDNHYYASTVKYNVFKKTRAVVNNETIYTVGGFNHGGFKTTSEADADAFLNFVITHISNSRRSHNPSSFIVDLTKWGIPKVISDAPSISLSVGNLETVNYSDMFQSTSTVPITYSVVSKKPSVATARIVTSSTSVVITGIATGTAVIEVTATNRYGSIKNNINVTVP